MYILFDERFIDRILSGEKTQTRRNLKYKYCRDTVYAAKVDPELPPFAWLHVLEVTREPLMNISAADCLAEGMKDYLEFMKSFKSYYPGLLDNEIVQVIKFKVIDIRKRRKANVKDE